MARVLVVDDSLTVYHKVKAELSMDGHRVDRLDTFAALPAYLQTQKPDLIVLDLEMPALSGIAYAQFVRRYEVARTPILVYSSRPVEELVAARDEIGAADFVRKGASGDLLRNAVARALVAGPHGSKGSSEP